MIMPEKACLHGAGAGDKHICSQHGPRCLEVDILTRTRQRARVHPDVLNAKVQLRVLDCPTVDLEISALGHVSEQ